MSQTVTIRRASPPELDTISGTLAQAFATDPAFEWVWQDDPTLGREITRAFFQAFAAFALEAGEVFADETTNGVAIWLPFDPADQHDDPALGEALAAACGPFAEKFGIVDSLMAAAHPMDVLHAYLPFIGVAPRGQGQGIGSALLDSRLRDLDRAGLPAYLEATTIDSVRLYRRHGFEHMPHTIDLPNGPSMYPMWRESRAA
jgi:ribosomal protein S18 acetylase RimI-like enzyme